MSRALARADNTKARGCAWRADPDQPPSEARGLAPPPSTGLAERPPRACGRTHKARIPTHTLTLLRTPPEERENGRASCPQTAPTLGLGSLPRQRQSRETMPPSKATSRRSLGSSFSSRYNNNSNNKIIVTNRSSNNSSKKQ